MNLARVAMVCLSAFFAPFGLAQGTAAPSNSDLLKRIEELEARENSRSAKEKIATQRGPAFVMGGYFSIVYREDHETGRNSSTFDQHRFVPQMEFRVHEKCHFRAEIEIEGGGTAPFLTNNYILVEYAEVDFHLTDWFVPKAGLILIPWGKYNSIHDDPFHNLFDRPIVSTAIGGAAHDSPGVGASGSVRSDSITLGYDFALTQGFKDNFTSTGGARDARNSFRRDNNMNKAIWTRLHARPDFGNLIGLDILSVEAGGSITYQKPDAGNNEPLFGHGFDLGIKVNSGGEIGFDVEAEYMRIAIDREDQTKLNGMNGWYAQGTIRFRPWSEGDMDGWLSESGYLALVFRYDQVDLDDRRRGMSTGDDRQAWTAGVAFRPFSKLVLRTEMKWVNSSGNVPDEADKFVVSLSFFF